MGLSTNSEVDAGNWFGLLVIWGIGGKRSASILAHPGNTQRAHLK